MSKNSEPITRRASRMISARGLNLTFPPFSPPAWLRNNHVQTIVASQKARRLPFGWQSWEPVEIELGKDGKVLAEVSWQAGERNASPLLLLMHGLEGSARSHYLVGMSKKAFDAGFHTARLNTRNCGGTEHLTSTLYCAALSGDVLAAVRHFKERAGISRIYAAAVSLGGNILLKFLGEQGDAALGWVQGAAVLSVPIDLDAGVRKMEEKQNWFYQRYFVRKLIARMRRKTVLFPGIGDMRRIEQIRSIREFDDVVTAPHFGFGNAGRYYRMASCISLLPNIRVPTLMLQAEDDPLVPIRSYVDAGIEGNPALQLVVTRHGGHSGFLQSRPAIPADRDGYWGESRAIQFLSSLAMNHPNP